jgi:YD repeat-containing protein
VRDDGTGRTSTNPIYYLRDNDGTLIADRATHGSPVCYYILDGQGSVIGMTDQNGQLVRSYKYDPFGGN